MINKIDKISIDAVSLIKDADQSVVHSTFASSINIITKNKLITLQNCKHKMTPFSININKEVNFKKFNIKPGDEVFITDRNIIINDDIFNLENYDIWEGKIKPKYKIIQKNLDCLERISKKYCKKSSISFKNIINEFVENNQINNFIDNISLLIGAGEGLTPSGDDFIVGVLSILYLFEKKKEFKEASKEILENINKTTDISKEYLKYALKGVYSQTIIELLEEISKKESSKIEEKMIELINTGATSGSDTLQGIIYGIKFCENNKRDD